MRRILRTSAASGKYAAGLPLTAQLHTGQQVHYLHWADGKLRSARVVGMHGDHVTVQDTGYSKAFKVHYAAILTPSAAA